MREHHLLGPYPLCPAVHLQLPRLVYDGKYSIDILGLEDSRDRRLVLLFGRRSGGGRLGVRGGRQGGREVRRSWRRRGRVPWRKVHRSAKHADGVLNCQLHFPIRRYAQLTLGGGGTPSGVLGNGHMGMGGAADGWNGAMGGGGPYAGMKNMPC